MVLNDALKRKIPAGWDVRPLFSCFAKQKSGEWGTDDEISGDDVRVICIRGADINALNGHDELTAPTRYISLTKIDKYLTPFDLVIEISGGSPTQSTGRIALVSPEIVDGFELPLVCSNFCKALTLLDIEQSYYFLQLWNMLYFSGAFFGWEGKTSGIKNLLFDSFVNSYMAPFPPTDLMRQFHKICRLLDEKIQNGLRENHTLNKLRDWLLPLLMNGQVRVI